jgi:hypothetical protein
MRALSLVVAGAAVLVIALALNACGTLPSRAWCANINDGRIDCAYDTFEQCQAMVSGLGGACTENTGRVERRGSRRLR